MSGWLGECKVDLWRVSGWGRVLVWVECVARRVGLGRVRGSY